MDSMDGWMLQRSEVYDLSRKYIERQPEGRETITSQHVVILICIIATTTLHTRDEHVRALLFSFGASDSHT